MDQKKFEFGYEQYADISELSADDASLLRQARSVTAHAYAPYSHFRVAAVARLKDGSTLTGTNQENASYPVGICAERVLLGNLASTFPNIAVDSIAISYDNEGKTSAHPISPCGMCRQALLEYEGRMKEPIRLILSGQEGPVFIVKTVRYLLPFAFTGEELA